MKFTEAQKQVGQRVMANLSLYSGKTQFFSTEVRIVATVPLGPAKPQARYPQLPHPIRVYGPRPSGLVLVEQVNNPDRRYYISPRQIGTETPAEYVARTEQMRTEREQREAQAAQAQEYVGEVLARLQQHVPHAQQVGRMLRISIEGEAISELRVLLDRIEHLAVEYS